MRWGLRILENAQYDSIGRAAPASTGSGEGHHIFPYPPAPKELDWAAETNVADNGRKHQFYIRKSVASGQGSAETKIDYALLDNSTGRPGQLGELSTPEGTEALANCIGRKFGAVAAQYWRARYCIPRSASRNLDRLIASLRKAGLIKTTRRHHQPALYSLPRHPGENDVMGCPSSWLDMYFGGELSAIELLTLMALKSFEGYRGIEPAQNTLGCAIGSSEATAQRATRSLEAKGHISASLVKGRRHNRYRIRLAAGSSKPTNPEKVKTTVSMPPGSAKTTDLQPYNQIQEDQEQRGEGGRKHSVVVEASVAPRPQLPTHLVRGRTEADSGAWRRELAPIEEALRPHAEAIGRASDYGSDVGLAGKYWEWTGGEPLVIRATAALISKTILRRHSGNSPRHRRNDWPQKLGAWGWAANEAASHVEALRNAAAPSMVATVVRPYEEGSGCAAAVSESPMADQDLRGYLAHNAAAIRATGVSEYLPVADSLERILAEMPAVSTDLEGLEHRLTDLEQKLIALGRGRQTDEQAVESQREFESYLRPYRNRMTAPQITILEAQFLEQATLDDARLPRLSLFYSAIEPALKGLLLSRARVTSKVSEVSEIS